MAKKVDENFSKILLEASSSIPIYETKELSKVSENIHKAIEVIISDLIDVFGAEEFNAISSMFDEISRMPHYELEDSYKQIILHSKFQIFNEDNPVHKYATRDEFPHTDIYDGFVKILDSINNMKPGYSYEPIKQSVIHLEKICQDDNPKKRKKNFDIAEKIANFCLNEIDGSYPNFTTTKILRYISIMEVIKESDVLTFDIRDENDILNVFNFVQKTSIASTVILLTDDKSNFIEEDADGIRLLMKYISNIQSMINVGKKRWDLYASNAEIVHKKYQQLLKSDEQANINRLIEQYCKEYEADVLLNDKELVEIQEEIKKAQKMENSNSNTQFIKMLEEKIEERISGLKTHRIIKSAKLKKEYEKRYGTKQTQIP